MSIKKQLKKESKILITPMLKQKTLNQFKLEIKPKKLFIMPFTILLASALLLFLIIFTPRRQSEHILIVTINPSMMIHYEKEHVKTITPLNEDAVLLLYDLKDLKGLHLNEALLKIDEKAKRDGYLNDLNITHLGKDNLKLDNFTIIYNQRKAYQQRLLAQGFDKKAVNVSDDDLIRLMFNTNQARLAALEDTLIQQTSKIDNLIQSNLTETKQTGEAVLGRLKNVLLDLNVDMYQDVMRTYFDDEPIYADETDIKAQLKQLIEQYDEYIRYQSITIKTHYQNEFKNMLGIIKDNDFNLDVLDAYMLDEKPTTDIDYTLYKNHTRAEKVLLGLVDEMTKLLQMQLRGKVSNERLRLLFTYYTELKESPDISEALLNSALIKEFEILYENKGE